METRAGFSVISWKGDLESRSLDLWSAIRVQYKAHTLANLYCFLLTNIFKNLYGRNIETIFDRGATANIH